MATFVLIHGAFRGGWSWQRVRRLLQADGHEVFAPSLTGAGERAHLNRADLTLEIWIKDVVNLLEYEDLREVILVGHSQGGIVITAASECAAERIAHLVYLDAPVPNDGQAAIDLIPEHIKARFGKPSRHTLNPPLPVSPGADFSPEEANWINARLTPLAAAPSFEPIRLTNPAALNLPRTYVFCERTPDFFPSAFTRQNFDREGIHYRVLKSGHDLMLSCPVVVADLLIEIASEEKSCLNLKKTI